MSLYYMCLIITIKKKSSTKIGFVASLESFYRCVPDRIVIPVLIFFLQSTETQNDSERFASVCGLSCASTLYSAKAVHIC